MATPTYPVGLIRTPGETLSLTTALISTGIPPGVYQALIYVPSTDFRMHLNPAILEARFYDATNSAGARYVAAGSSGSLTQDLIDRSTGTGTGTVMNSATTSDRLYICFADIIGGIYVTIGNTNSNDSVLSAAYLKNDNTWAALTILDGTIAVAGKTLGQSASITWTAPTDWKWGLLREGAISDTDAPATGGMWLRFAWNGALDSTTSITELWTLNRATDRGYFRLGVEYPLSLDRRSVGAIEAILAAGTDTMQITWLRTVK